MLSAFKEREDVVGIRGRAHFSVWGTQLEMRLAIDENDKVYGDFSYTFTAYWKE